MTGLHKAMEHHLENESWDSIAQMAIAFQIELSGESRHAARLRKEMALIKHLLYENIKTPELAERNLDADFYVRLYKTIDKLERSFKRYELERTEFLVFLHAVLHRIKREKLQVHKPLERKNEFRKLKDVKSL
jgi:hypothetical protein